MKNLLMIEKLGIEFENMISDEDSIAQVSGIVKLNKNNIKNLII